MYAYALAFAYARVIWLENAFAPCFRRSFGTYVIFFAVKPKISLHFVCNCKNKACFENIFKKVHFGGGTFEKKYSKLIGVDGALGDYLIFLETEVAATSAAKRNLKLKQTERN